MTKQEVIDYVNTNHQNYGAYGFHDQYAAGVMIENEWTHKTCFINEKYIDSYTKHSIDNIINHYNRFFR